MKLGADWSQGMLAIIEAYAEYFVFQFATQNYKD
jgi:hypothetical protein